MSLIAGCIRLLSPALLRPYSVLLLVLYSQQARAQATNSSLWRKLNPDSLVARPLRFIPIPVLQSSPETGLKGGLALDYFFNTGTPRRPRPLDSARVTRDSYAFVQGLYSTRRQLTLEGVWQLYSPAERYILRGRAGYQDFSEYYWGVGNETLPEKEYADIFYQRWYVQSRVWRRVQSNYFVGLSYYYCLTQNLRATQEISLAETQPGGAGSRVSGLGPTLLADFRNNPFSPTRGWYAEWSWQVYARALGSEFRYTEHLVDVRRYFALPGHATLGVQAVANLTSGTVPLRELPRLGGPNILRGFTLGRYRERQLWSAQTEYRRPFNRFLVGAVFAAAGGVAGSVDAFSLADTRYAGGAGLRVLLNKKKNLYSRFDLALNSNGTINFYFRMMDAF